MNYVIGDIHGCYNALIKLLEKLHLTEEDRVFFVGDFVDRAPDHEQMLKTNQWFCDHITENGQFQAVIGNHDLDILDTYHKMSPYDDDIMAFARSYLMPDGDGMIPILSDTYDSLGEVVKKIRALPLYLEVEAGGFRNIITHSWLCDKWGNSVIADDGSIGEDYDIKSSVWDREHSIEDNPGGCRVIHGHTITSCECYKAEQMGVQNRIIFQGDTNVNVDCGCFMGLANGGNLAAFRLEDGAEFYAFDINDAIAEYRELAELSCDQYKLRDYQIFMVCNPFREKVFLYDSSDYTKYILDSVTSELQLDYSNQEEFFRYCWHYMSSWRTCVKRNSERDSRFVIWED